MGFRVFTDARGARWHAWEVRPAPRERRSGRDRRAGVPADPRAERRRGPERRVRDLGRPTGVAAALAGGWLCFEPEARDGAAVRRRLAPIPHGWEVCSEATLRGYLDRAAQGAASRSA